MFIRKTIAVFACIMLATTAGVSSPVSAYAGDHYRNHGQQRHYGQRYHKPKRHQQRHYRQRRSNNDNSGAMALGILGLGVAIVGALSLNEQQQRQQQPTWYGYDPRRQYCAGRKVLQYGEPYCSTPPDWR